MGDGQKTDTLHESSSVGSSDDDPLSRFLSMFQTHLDYRKPESRRELWVFWSQNQRSQHNSSLDNTGMLHENFHPWPIHEKIKSLFQNFDNYLVPFDGLIQFWAPVTIGGKCLLTTSHQPFALTHIDNGLDGLRLCSVRYPYNVVVENLETEGMIIFGAPTAAFLNHFPQLVLDASVHQGHLLGRSALQCGLKTYFVLPICDPSRSHCVGVLECYTRDYDILRVFESFYEALKGEGLSTFYVQERLPYKSIHGLNGAKDEIEKALKIVVATYQHIIFIAQVWIPYEDKNNVHYLSFMEDTQMKRISALKLVGEFIHDEWGFYNDFYPKLCNMLPLKMGEGVSGKTLENHEAHFCDDISRLTGNVELLASCIKTKWSCFAICLRSTYTGDFNYVFEFLLPRHQNYVALFESLMLTLKRYLPSFKFASGVELGDELCVVDVENSLGNEVGSFTICQEIRSSPISRVAGEETRQMIEECMVPPKVKRKTAPKSLSREEIEQQFGKTMKEAATNLKVSVSTLKRKCGDYGINWPRPPTKSMKKSVNELYENQTHVNEEDNNAIQDPSSVVNVEKNLEESFITIKAEYGEDVIRFNLPISQITLVAVKEKIEESFQLNHVIYKLKYHDDEGELILMTCDQHLRDCVKISRLLNNIVIRLRVTIYAPNFVCM